MPILMPVALCRTLVQCNATRCRAAVGTIGFMHGSGVYVQAALPRGTRLDWEMVVVSTGGRCRRLIGVVAARVAEASTNHCGKTRRGAIA